ncbi:MAG: hypothetical protein VSS75_020035 [Candidatus Parabeggiatoa sp.]|nr:hypothetical protein [Candidatus Parabeggiatoa sp.]
MKNIFVDCDILLDVGLEREPFYHASSELLNYLEAHPNTGFIAWHSISNVFYIGLVGVTRFYPPYACSSRSKSMFHSPPQILREDIITSVNCSVDRVFRCWWILLCSTHSTLI